MFQPVPSLFVDAGLEQIQANVSEYTYHNLTGDELERALNTELSQDPRNWVAIESLEQISEQNGYDFSEETRLELEKSRDQDHSFTEFSKDCLACMWSADQCELNTAMACGIAINLTPIGDVAGIARAGTAYLQGDEIDQLDVALSIIGLSATGLALVSGGSSASVKAGAGFLKFAHAAGKLPPAITRTLITAAQDGIIWRNIPNARSIDELKLAMNTHALAPAIEAASDIGAIADKSGLQQSLYLMSRASDVEDLRKTRQISDVLGEQTVGYFSIFFGKSRLLRLTTVLANGVIGMLIGMVGLVSSLSLSIILNGFRRLLKSLSD